MSRHTSRSTYSVPVPRILSELTATNGKCPHFTAESSPHVVAEPPQSDLAPEAPQPANDSPEVEFRFGRMFDEPAATVEVLTQLGLKMGGQSKDSNNPSGYTYLGQFIAHEITFDKTKGLPANGSIPNNYRSPQIDLDSLYGSDERFFQQENPALLKVGLTVEDGPVPQKRNDLFRDEASGKAIIADERNDENLALAQVQVAFMRFHNAIATRLLTEGTQQAQLREAARAEVVKHFQWIVLHDFLETLLDPDVLGHVLANGPRFFRPDAANLFMPLEFSTAVFRLGHSMVRPSYEWNFFHSKELNAVAGISELFRETNFSGFIRPDKRSTLRLQGRWIIDWRRFFNFDVITNNQGPIYAAPNSEINHARQIDTLIDLDLASVDSGFDHNPFTGEQRSLAVRNLLRGYALGLPTGESVAEWMGETPLEEAEITAGFEDCFNSRWLKGKTPLWFYILREAELKGNGDRLGRVGSRIVAETLLVLIHYSRYSILRQDWQPREDASRPGPQGTRVFQMVDLLHFADVVNPINL